MFKDDTPTPEQKAEGPHSPAPDQPELPEQAVKQVEPTIESAPNQETTASPSPLSLLTDDLAKTSADISATDGPGVVPAKSPDTTDAAAETDTPDVSESFLDSLIAPDVQLKQDMAIGDVVGKVLGDLTSGWRDNREATPTTPDVEEPEEPATASVTSVGEEESEPVAASISTSVVEESKEPATASVTSVEEPEEPAIASDASVVGLDDSAWVEQFEALPVMEHQDVVARLQAGEVIRGHALPFLNLISMDLEHPVIFENCRMVGMAARSSTFQQELCLRNCWVQERFVVGDTKRGDSSSKPTLLSGVRLEGCRFDDRFLVVRATVEGDIRITQCVFARTLSWDRSRICGQVRVVGPGKVSGMSLFRSELTKNLHLSHLTIYGDRKNPALGLKKARISGGVEIQSCELEGNVDFTRANIGEDVYRALRVENSTILRLFLNQAVFRGEVQIQDSVFLGMVSAEPPRSEHGHQIGKPTVFEGDTTFGGCEFKGKCQFQNTQFLAQTHFSHCQFHKGGTFNQATFAKDVGFWESSSTASLHFRKAHFQGFANFGRTVLAGRSSFNEAIFEQTATFHESQCEGDVFFSGATFADQLKMGRLECKGGLTLQNIEVKGQINLLQANVHDRLILSDSRIGSLCAPGIHIGTWGTLANSTIQQDLLMEGCRVGNKAEATEDKEYVPGSLYLDSLVCQGSLKMSSAVVRGNLSLDCANIHREVELMGAQVGAALSFSKGYFRDIVRCERSTCGGALLANITRFRDEVSFNHMTCQSVSLGGSSFDQGFTMRNTTISDVLTLNNVDVDGKADLSKCTFQRIFFDHLLVDYLMIDREQLSDHLTSEEIGNYEQAKNEYGILRQAFLVRHRYQDMDWAYYRFCQVNRKSKPRSLLSGLEWLTLDLGFGYGTRPMNIAGVALGIVLLFAMAFILLPQGIAAHTGQALQQLGILDAVHLSVLTFASMEYSSHIPHKDHWLRYLFALEGLFGIFLITLFVATISRKIIRS